jgi:hypothetical protein
MATEPQQSRTGSRLTDHVLEHTEAALVELGKARDMLVSDPQPGLTTWYRFLADHLDRAKAEIDAALISPGKG